MSCDLTTGRTVSCKDAFGGLKAVYFVDFGGLDVVSYDITDTDMVAGFSSTTATWFQYDLKGTNTFDQKITTSRENGTSSVEQTLNLTLTKLNIQTHKELKLLFRSRPHVVVEDNNGSFFIMGLEYGSEVLDGTAVSGATGNDLNGYTLVITATEKTFANFLDTSLTNVLGAGATISTTQITA